MSSKPRGPFTFKGAFVIDDPLSFLPKVIFFQYNPERLQRSLQPQMAGGENNDRTLNVRFTGAPIQTINITAEFDAADELDRGGVIAQISGLYPRLAALELLAAPDTDDIKSLQRKLSQGIMEVAASPAPNVYFVWGMTRVLPVRINQFTITEEEFDSLLNPIRASVQIDMRVLTYSDLDSSHQSYKTYMFYQHTMEAMEKVYYASAAFDAVKDIISLI